VRPSARHFYPLLLFVVPTLVMGYGVVLPRNGITGFNEITMGFASALVGACFAYISGVRSVFRASAVTNSRQHRDWGRPAFIARQSARPSGVLGWIVAHVMALETSAANEVTIALAELRESDQVLEVGCGHGRALARIAGLLSTGSVVGVDPSETMIRLAVRHNRKFIAHQKVRIVKGEAADLPYREATFDRVLTTHTVYFWRDLAAVLSELRRVLKPGGHLVIGFGDADTMQGRFPECVYILRSVDQIQDALKDAGFTSVHIESRATSHGRLNWAIAE
jgi:SAM-dependent methyltransferase